MIVTFQTRIRPNAEGSYIDNVREPLRVLGKAASAAATYLAGCHIPVADQDVRAQVAEHFDESPADAETHAALIDALGKLSQPNLRLKADVLRRVLKLAAGIRSLRRLSAD